MSATLSDKAERVGDATSDFAANMKSDLSASAGDLRSDLRRWKDDVLAAIQREHADFNAEPFATPGSNPTTGQAIGKVADAVKSDVHRLQHRAEDFVAERPLKILGAALALGFVLGVLWRR